MHIRTKMGPADKMKKLCGYVINPYIHENIDPILKQAP